MFISDLDRPWLDTPFLIQGFLLDNDDDLRTLQRWCQYVYVDPTRSIVAVTGEPGVQVDPVMAAAAAKESVPLGPPGVALVTYEKEAPLVAELPRAQGTYVRTEGVLQQVMHEVQAGGHLHLEEVGNVVDDMVESVVSNPDAMIWVALLRGTDSAAFTHGIRVGVYLLALGRHLGFPMKELHHLGMIGLLLDLGKTKIRRELLDRRGKLNPAEFDEVKRHVDYALEMLAESSALPRAVLDGIAQHHERLNGLGYPRGLRGEQIGIYGRMAGIADCFTALTSPRPYNDASSPYDALSSLFKASGDYFHTPLVERFVQSIGAFPAGTLVELSTGEVGIVIRHNRVRRLQPTVLLITDHTKQQLERPMEFDLLYQQAIGQAEPVRIRRGLSAGAFGIDASAYYVGQTPSRDSSGIPRDQRE